MQFNTNYPGRTISQITDGLRTLTCISSSSGTATVKLR